MKADAPLRLDAALVARGLAPDLKAARAMVLAGQVLSGDTLLKGPAERLAFAAPLRVRGLKPFASRAGLKLEAALDLGALRVEGLRCLDLGASAGGFTDCLLRRGAASVLCVDVGRNQLDWRLRRDPRVRCREGVDYLDLDDSELPRPLGFACADLSFTSVRPVFARFARWLEAGASWSVLVKPQFEALSREVGKGGILRDETVRRRTLAEAESSAASAGLEVSGRAESPLAGTKGNREWLLWGVKPD